MICKIDNGQMTLAFAGAWVARDGKGSGHGNGFRIQFYWPKFVWKNYKRGEMQWQRAHKELLFSAPTVLRIVKEEKYFGIGFELIGFGAALDWQNQKENP